MMKWKWVAMERWSIPGDFQTMNKEVVELDKNTRWIVDYVQFVDSKDLVLSNSARDHANKMEDLRIIENRNQ